MELLDLKAAWQQQSMEIMPDRPNREIMGMLAARLEEIHRTLRRRDRREIGAAIVGIIGFGAWFWTVPEVVSRIGAAIVVAGSILIIVKLAWARSGGHEQRPHLQMCEFCASERDRINAQIRLLQSAFWWYLLPNLLGANLFVFGFTGFNVAGIGFLAATLLIGLVLYRLNVRAARERLAPVKDELDLLLAEIEKNEFSQDNNLSE
jgi:hypothetical protein